MKPIFYLLIIFFSLKLNANDYKINNPYKLVPSIDERLSEINNKDIIKNLCIANNENTISINQFLSKKIPKNIDDENIEEWNFIPFSVFSYMSKYYQTQSDLDAKNIKEAILHLAKNNYMTKTKNKNDIYYINTLLNTKDNLDIILYSLSILKINNQINNNDFDKILKWIDSVYKPYRSHKSMNTKQCIHNDKFIEKKDHGGCQNHTSSGIQVKTLYSILKNNNEDFIDGAKYYKFIIDDLKKDGALWKEAVRGSHSWKYYTHNLNDIIGIAEAYYIQGYDLYSYKSKKNNKNIHDAVKFFADALLDKNLMFNYAKELIGQEGRTQNWKDLTYYNQVINGYGSRMLWFYAYASRFPNHENVKKLSKYFPLSFLEEANSQHMGLNTQCFLSKKGIINSQIDIFNKNPAIKINDTENDKYILSIYVGDDEKVYPRGLYIIQKKNNVFKIVGGGNKKTTKRQWNITNNPSFIAFGKNEFYIYANLLLESTESNLSRITNFNKIIDLKKFTWQLQEFENFNEDDYKLLAHVLRLSGEKVKTKNRLPSNLEKNLYFGKINKNNKNYLFLVFPFKNNWCNKKTGKLDGDWKIVKNEICSF